VTAFTALHTAAEAAQQACESAKIDCKAKLAALNAALKEFKGGFKVPATRIEQVTDGDPEAVFSNGLDLKAAPAPAQPLGSVLSGNSIVSGSGGAIRIEGGAELTMKNSTVSGNVSLNAGGGIHARTAAVLELTGNKFTDNRAFLGGAILIAGLAADAVTATLSGNLYQANVATGDGGAIVAVEDSVFASKSDRFLGNVARTGQGGGLFLDNTGASTITGSLIQGNVAGSSGGGVLVSGFLTLSSVKVLDNVSGPGGRGGGLRIAGGVTTIAKSLITGNVANDGGGLFYNAGSLGIDTATVVKGNAPGINQNIGKA
jgi:hypothetical protein